MRYECDCSDWAYFVIMHSIPVVDPPANMEASTFEIETRLNPAASAVAAEALDAEFCYSFDEVANQ